MCPMFLGVRLVAAKSIERIHRANLINFGIVPATFASEADYDALAPGDALEVAGFRAAVEKGNALTLRNATKGTEIALKIDLLDKERAVLLAGGMLNYARASTGQS